MDSLEITTVNLGITTRDHERRLNSLEDFTGISGFAKQPDGTVTTETHPPLTSSTAMSGEPSGEKKWKPKENEYYYSINEDWTCVLETFWTGYGNKINNCFRTRSEAASFLSKIKALREDCK
jgi:hypothetical protein